MNEYGALPPDPPPVSVIAVPAVCGLVRFTVSDAADMGELGPTNVIGIVRTFPAPSVATTVITLAPVESVRARVQFALLFPEDVPPDAGEPFTVTLAMPLPPEPWSVAVPASVIIDELTVWPDEWLVMVSVGAVVSPAAVRVIERVDVLALPAPSVATTVNVFAPVESDTLRLQFAVPFPDAVPPVAADPLTVTLAMPLPPAPLSVAVPESMMLDVVTL